MYYVSKNGDIFDLSHDVYNMQLRSMVEVLAGEVMKSYEKYEDAIREAQVLTKEAEAATGKALLCEAINLMRSGASSLGKDHVNWRNRAEDYLKEGVVHG